MKLVTLFLTCANTIEADDIVKVLFAKHLVACIKQSPVNSTYAWQGKIETNEEVLLIIESVEKNFKDIEAVIKKIHSYETFVLTAYPVIKASSGVEKWVKESLSK